ncbi:MAG: hypothetical protein N7Q72_03785 [Spiroplasma sp. Tabriz.8]|nr:hypothetical protein [Spiroplasma sp. Tabriz.8]
MCSSLSLSATFIAFIYIYIYIYIYAKQFYFLPISPIIYSY